MEETGMKEIKQYMTEYSDEMIVFLTDSGIDYKLIPLGKRATIAFCTDIDDLLFPNIHRIFETFCFPQFDETEYENANWYRIFGKRDIVPWGKNWYTFEGKKWCQKSDFICSRKIRWEKYNIVTLETFLDFMLCKGCVKDDLIKYNDIVFKPVFDKNSKLVNDMYQMSFKTTIPLEAFEIQDQSKGEKREASIYNYTEGTVVHLRPGKIYIPKIKQQFLDGVDAVTTDSIWSRGSFALPICFISKKIYNTIRNKDYCAEINIWPIKTI